MATSHQNSIKSNQTNQPLLSSQSKTASIATIIIPSTPGTKALKIWNLRRIETKTMMTPNKCELAPLSKWEWRGQYESWQYTMLVELEYFPSAAGCSCRINKCGCSVLVTTSCDKSSYFEWEYTMSPPLTDYQPSLPLPKCLLPLSPLSVLLLTSIIAIPAAPSPYHIVATSSAASEMVTLILYEWENNDAIKKDNKMRER